MLEDIIRILLALVVRPIFGSHALLFLLSANAMGAIWAWRIKSDVWTGPYENRTFVNRTKTFESVLEKLRRNFPPNAVNKNF